MQIERDPYGKLSYKLLESMRGYFCHLAMTFPILFPYLKGFHLTLSRHLPNRNDDGWKISELEYIGHMEELKQKGIFAESNADVMDQKETFRSKAPEFVTPVPRFHTCLSLLKTLFKSEKVPFWPAQTSRLHLLIYGFVDTSKPGLGASLDTGSSVKYCIGCWGKDTKDESSNWCEFENLV